MTKVRSRGGARVDYTGMLSPAAEKLPARGGGGAKRKARDESEEPSVDEDELVVVKKSVKTKKPPVKKTRKTKTGEEDGVGEDATKPLVKKATTIAKRRKEETKRSDDDDGGADARQRQRGEQPENKPKKKTKRDNESTAAAVSQARRYEQDVVVRTSSSATPANDTPQDLAALRKKYEALREFRELETERLLQEAKILAKEEKRTYEKLVTKLKDEVASLLTRAQRVDSDHKKRQEELLAEHKQRIEALKRDQQDALETNERLRRRIKELETGATSGSSGRSGSVADSARVGDLTIELTQAKKLLELYRLVTSTELRLIEAVDDDDDAESETCTDVECSVVDSATGKRFVFDLAVPHDAREEVEYLPSDKPARDFKTPSYLQEELSFKRSELTKFMRTLLDVVVSKKKSAGESNR